MDRQFDPRIVEEFGDCTDTPRPGDALPVYDASPGENASKPGLTDSEWFHILWFSAAMLGMPALMIALALLT